MKAITNVAPDQLVMMDWPTPEPAPGQVRIRTHACGICATDLHMIAGWSRTAFPSIPGHEWAGTVDAVGANVAKNLIGQRCVGENVLPDGGEIGFEHPGGYGEFFVTESRNIYLIPDQLPMSIATLMEPLAVSIRGLRKLRLDNVHGALILGDGPIGLLMLVLLQSAGIEDICLVGGRDPHLELANDLGVRATFNYHQSKGDLARDLLAITGHHFPVVVEASGSELAIQASLEMVQKCGQILVLGDYGLARASFEWNHLLHQEIDIVGSNASAGAWPEAVSLANQEILPLERFVTHCFPASRFMDGIELARSRREEVIKVVLVWTQ